MTRSIPTKDFNKIVKNRTEHEMLQEQYQSAANHIRGQIEKMLISNNVIVTASVRDLCNKLFEMPVEERQSFLNDNWGPLYAQKVEPLFVRLDTLTEDYKKLLGPAQS